MVQKFLTLFKLGYPNFWRRDNTLIEKFITFLLLPFTSIYFFVSKISIKKVGRVGVPVVCVGNLNTGGSGKTPFVIYLANLLKEKKINVHIVTRGYLGKLNGPIKVDKKKHTYLDVGDEAMLLSDLVTTWVSKNRYEGAVMATLDGADLIILDDGLQNYSLHQNFKIIMVDGSFGFGNGFLLPSGPLREAVIPRLKKSDLLIISNKDEYGIEKKLKNKIPIFHVSSKIKRIEKLKNKKIVGFTGIGKPENFLNSLKKKKLNVIKFFAFPDHYNFGKKKIDELIKYANKNKSILVSTEKDKQRINSNQRNKIFFVNLKIELKEKSNLINFLKKKKIV